MNKRFFLTFLIGLVLAATVSSDTSAATYRLRYRASTGAVFKTYSAVNCNSLLGGDPLIIKIQPAPGQPAIRPEEIGVLRFASYNMENFFYHVGQHVHVEPNKMALLFGGGAPKEKDPKKTKAIAKIIGQDIKPDILGLQEIDNEKALDQFNKEHLASLYDAIVRTGNDSRHIEVGTDVKRSLPFEVEVFTNTHLMWDDPADPKGPQKLFSRDAPVSVFRLPGIAKPLFVTIVVHSKSKKDRPGDMGSDKLRTRQHEEIARLIREVQTEFGKEIPIVVKGDTNSDVNHGPELRPIRDLGFRDVLDVMNVAEADRTTHTFHPNDGPTENHQMDAIYISPSLFKYLRHAQVYRYKDADGNILPYPKTFEERALNPSDHFPLYADIDFTELVRALLASP